MAKDCPGWRIPFPFFGGQLGPPVVRPFTVSSLGEGSPTKIDDRKKGTLILTTLLEDLGRVSLLTQPTKKGCPFSRPGSAQGVEPPGLGWGSIARSSVQKAMAGSSVFNLLLVNPLFTLFYLAVFVVCCPWSASAWRRRPLARRTREDSWPSGWPHLLNTCLGEGAAGLSLRGLTALMTRPLHALRLRIWVVLSGAWLCPLVTVGLSAVVMQAAFLMVPVGLECLQQSVPR